MSDSPVLRKVKPSAGTGSSLQRWAQFLPISGLTLWVRPLADERRLQQPLTDIKKGSRVSIFNSAFAEVQNE
jgi:hypothetical protein